MKKPSLYLYVSFLILGLSIFLLINSVSAWTLPTANPPQGDLSAPLDTSSIEQTKLGNLNLDNNLKVGGLLRVGLYSSHPTGTNGNLYYNTTDNKFYGYKNGSWSELGGGGSAVTSVFGRTGAVIAKSGDYTVDQITGAAPLDSPTFTGTVTMPGTGIWNSSGNVGIGTSDPIEKLEVSGNIKLSGDSPMYKITNLATPTADTDAATKGYVDAGAIEYYTDCYVSNSSGSLSCSAGYTTIINSSGNGCSSTGNTNGHLRTLPGGFTYGYTVGMNGCPYVSCMNGGYKFECAWMLSASAELAVKLVC